MVDFITIRAVSFAARIALMAASTLDASKKILLRIIVGQRSDYGKIRIFVCLAFALSYRKIQLKSSFATLAQKAIDLFIRMELLPWFSGATFSDTTSKIRTSLCCANSMAKERPTYPIPATAIFIEALPICSTSSGHYSPINCNPRFRISPKERNHRKVLVLK